MKKVIYCKYNLNRAPEFQTKTIIYQDGNEKYIEKYALTEAAQLHMDVFEQNYYLVEKLYPAIEFVRAEKVGQGVRYPYINGIPLDEILGERVHQWSELLPELKKMIDDIYVMNEEYHQDFIMTEEFRRMFGDIDCQGDTCVCPCNLDVIFDNLMFVDGKIVAFDYEWVYNFPIPHKYVIYRILCRFYDKYLHYLEHHFTFDEYIAAFDFNEEEKKRYRRMEDAFISHIYAGGDAVFQNSTYKRSRTSYTQIRGMENQLVHAVEDYNRAMEVLHNTEKEYLLTIERLNEAARLKTEADAHIAILQNAYDSVIQSKSWKMTKPLRLCVRGIKKIKSKGLKSTALKVGEKISQKLFAKKDSLNENYVNELISLIEASKEVQEEQKNTYFDKEYKISIITPLFNTPENFLVELLESVQNQTYANWEFCLVNFSTTEFESVDKICRIYAEKDSRISYHIVSENKGIAENTNTCISYATGEYIGLLDHDDILHPCALYEVTKVINETNADFVYTDEVKFTNGIQNVFSPNFKPDFSSDELRAHNYICHFNVYKTSLYYEVGGYRKEFDGSQDHDIVLRLTEKAERIVHIPQILYYWRVHVNSVAKSIDAKSYATDAGANAVTGQLKRMGEQQYAESVVGHIPLYRIRTEIEEKTDVTVIIWNAENAEQVQKSVDSVKGIPECRCIVLESDERSLGEQCNTVMKSVDTKYVLFLHAGLQVKPEEFGREFMIYANRKDIATIDCKVLTEQNTIYSGGAYLSGDIGMPVKLRCMGGPQDYSGYENGMLHSRNVTVATGLCTFVNVAVWRQSIGFSNTNSMCMLLEYSYQMWKNGKNNIWIPFIEAYGMNKKVQQQYISDLSELNGKEYEKRDVYFSEHILRLRLE